MGDFDMARTPAESQQALFRDETSFIPARFLEMAAKYHPKRGFLR